MKGNIVKQDIERSGVSNTTGFKIKASAKAFRILSDGLYSDKVLAVIRELSSNALDAHVANGNPEKPFNVHMPNRIEPYFSIRDYGTGLSHKDVMDLYSTYFDSTKTESNDFTGALGLGSKSPFSYTESFSVTSYFNGEMRLYLIDMGEEGIPQISMVDGFPIQTLEHNGLEIKLSVKAEDFREFEQKAQAVYRRYNPLPKIKGNENFAVHGDTVSLSGTDWKVYETNNANQRQQKAYYAVQGSVAYPIEYDKLVKSLDDRELKNLNMTNSYNSMYIELDFDIGDLDVAANRESLGYDERTCENIRTKLLQFKKEICADMSKQFDSCKSLWDANLLYNKMFGSRHPYDDNKNKIVYSIVRNNLKYKGQNVNGEIRLTATKEDFSFSTNKYNASYRMKKRQSKNYSYWQNSSSISIHPSEHLIFVWDDLEGKKSSSNRYRYLVSQEQDDNKIFVLLKCKTVAIFNEVARTIGLGIKGDNKILCTSDLPLPPKSNPLSVKRTNAYEIETGFVSYEKDVFKRNPAYDLTNNKGYYVVLDNKRVDQMTALESVGTGFGFANSKLAMIIHNMETSGLIDATKEKVIGVNKIGLKKIKKMSNWKELFAHAKTSMDDAFVKNESDLVAYSRLRSFKTNNYQRSKLLLKFILMINTNVKHPLFKQLSDDLVVVVDTPLEQKMEALTSIDNALRLGKQGQLAGLHDMGVISSRVKTMMSKYPLLELIMLQKNNATYTQDEIKHIIKYINSI